MTQLTEALFETWMKEYKIAWETRDPEKAVSLFSEDAEYFINPFEPLKEGQKEIMLYWEDVPIFQTNIVFDYEVLFVKENKGYALCHGSFESVASGAKMIMEGMFEITFNEDKKCKLFRQWWHEKEELPFT